MSHADAFASVLQAIAVCSVPRTAFDWKLFAAILAPTSVFAIRARRTTGDVLSADMTSVTELLLVGVPS